MRKVKAIYRPVRANPFSQHNHDIVIKAEFPDKTPDKTIIELAGKAVPKGTRFVEARNEDGSILKA